MLPKLYSLSAVPVGEITSPTPAANWCPVCGYGADPYWEVEVAVDRWEECDLIGGDEPVLLASERLLAELERIGATGYTTWPARLTVGDQAHVGDPHIEQKLAAAPQFRHLVVTGRCDGPWVDHEQIAHCPKCGRPLWRVNDPADLRRRIVKGELDRRLVYADAWHGEDFFLLPEPGPVIITERVAEILCRMGSLRKEKIVDQEYVRRTMPRFAETLERAGWELPVCAELGPAEWVIRR